MKHTFLLIAALIAVSCSTKRHVATSLTQTDSLTVTTTHLHHQTQLQNLLQTSSLTVDTIQITLPPAPDGAPSPRITLKGLQATTRSHQTTQTTDTAITQTATTNKTTTTAHQTTQSQTVRATTPPFLKLTLLLLFFLILFTKLHPRK